MDYWKCTRAGLLLMVISTAVGVIGAVPVAIMFLVSLNSSSGLMAVFDNRLTIPFLVVFEIGFFGFGFWREYRRQIGKQKDQTQSDPAITQK